jgi:hypothetical protein
MPEARAESIDGVGRQAGPACSTPAAATACTPPAAEAEWDVVSVAEAVPVGSALDLLLRQEQTEVLLELATLAAKLGRQ